MEEGGDLLAVANALWRRGELEAAMAATQRAIREQPRFPLLYRNLAWLGRRCVRPPQESGLLLALADQVEAIDPRWWRLASRARPGSPQLEQQRAVMAASDLWDEAWYAQQHPVLPLLAMEPAEHWLRCGVALLWNPSGRFDSRFYVEQHGAVDLQGENPLLHYLRAGRDQGLAATPAVFSEALRRSTSQLWGPHRERGEAELRRLPPECFGRTAEAMESTSDRCGKGIAATRTGWRGCGSSPSGAGCGTGRRWSGLRAIRVSCCRCTRSAWSCWSNARAGCCCEGSAVRWRNGSGGLMDAMG